MKKQVICLSVVLAAVMGLRSAETANPNLVQKNINVLKSQLKNDAPYSEERRRLVGYLKRHFNNKMNNGTKKLKKLSDQNARTIANSITSTYDDMVKNNHREAAQHYAERSIGVIDMNVRPRGLEKSKASLKKVQPTAAEPVAKSKKSSGWLQDMESKLGFGDDEEPSQKPVSRSVGRAGGVAAAGTAGAAAGTVTASRGQKAKAPAKKVVDPKKKAQKLERKKKRAVAAKKAGAKKPRTKPMSEKKKAKKARQAAAAQPAKAN